MSNTIPANAISIPVVVFGIPSVTFAFSAAFCVELFISTDFDNSLRNNDFFEVAFRVSHLTLRANSQRIIKSNARAYARGVLAGSLCAGATGSRRFSE